MHRQKFLVGYTADCIDVGKITFKRQLLHDIIYILKSPNLNLPIVATKKAFIRVQALNEFAVSHKKGVDGWAEDQGEQLRAMCRHVSQKMCLASPPKWFLSLNLGSKDPHETANAVEDVAGEDLEEALAAEIEKTQTTEKFSGGSSKDKEDKVKAQLPKERQIITTRST